MVDRSQKDWFKKPDDALQAYWTAYKSPLGTTPYRLLFRKSCHLLVELEHKAYQGIRTLNFDLKAADEKRFLQLNELDELCLEVYESSKIYKESTKNWHDKHIMKKRFQVGDTIMLLNHKLQLFLCKQRSWWSKPFKVMRFFSHGAVKVWSTTVCTVKVNGQHLKLFLCGGPR